MVKPVMKRSVTTAAVMLAVALPAHASQDARAFITTYCAGCHNERVKAGNLVLDGLDVARVVANAETWEKVVRKLRTGLMPPPGRPGRDEATYDRFLEWLQSELDRAAAEHPDPGRTEVLHRLNRMEYRNAIRDLLSLDVDIVTCCRRILRATASTTSQAF